MAEPLDYAPPRARDFCRIMGAAVLVLAVLTGIVGSVVLALRFHLHR
jgi:hypothetical protein